MSRWEEALDVQTSLLDFWRKPAGQRYALDFAADTNKKGRPGGDIYAASPQIEGAKLERGSPVFVEADVLDLVDAAAETFRPEPFLAEDMFVEEGFALFERAVTVLDVNGRTCSFRAMSWGPVAIQWETEGKKEVKPFFHCCLYTHCDDEDDYRDDHYRERAENGETPEDVRRSWHEVFGGPFSMFHVSNIPFGSSPEEVEHNTQTRAIPEKIDVRAETMELDQLWRFLQAFFRLAQQRIAAPSERRAPRASRRRAQRIGKEAENVLVITLRREKRTRDFGEERDVEWTRRWMVGAHWRNQWYPTLGIHRQIWIAPYVKGPEDKPLVLHAGRAYEFVR